MLCFTTSIIALFKSHLEELDALKITFNLKKGPFENRKCNVFNSPQNLIRYLICLLSPLWLMSHIRAIWAITIPFYTAIILSGHCIRYPRERQRRRRQQQKHVQAHTHTLAPHICTRIDRRRFKCIFTWAMHIC